MQGWVAFEHTKLYGNAVSDLLKYYKFVVFGRAFPLGESNGSREGRSWEEWGHSGGLFGVSPAPPAKISLPVGELVLPSTLGGEKGLKAEIRQRER